jgi:hypothetical protein
MARFCQVSFASTLQADFRGLFARSLRMGFLGWYGVPGFDFGGWRPTFDIICGYFCPLIV